MAERQSRIFADMDPNVWGLATEVRVQVLEHEQFVQRYVDVVAMGDTVLRSGGYIGRNIRRLGVHPWELGDRQRVYERQVAHGATLYATFPEPPKGPIPREEAERQVNNLLQMRQKIKAYERRDPVARVINFLRFLRGDESNYMLLPMDPWEDLPDVITFRGEDGKMDEVVINREAEARYEPV